MELLTVQETATMLKLSPVTIRRYIASGRLPAVKVGRGVRIRRDAVDGLLTPVLPPHLRDDPEDDLSIPEGTPMTRNNSLFTIAAIAGSADADGPMTDFASDKYACLVEAYADRHEESCSLQASAHGGS